MPRNTKTMEVRDARILTGPSLLLKNPGAVLDITCGNPRDGEFATATWPFEARSMLSRMEWGHVELASQQYAGGFSLALEAPIDRLPTAIEALKLTWTKTLAEINASLIPGYMEMLESLSQAVAAAGTPALPNFEILSILRKRRFLWDDQQISLGMGRGSRIWSIGSLPKPDAVPWDDLHDIPAALITGTNGKTTVLRLLAAMARAAGLQPGMATSEGAFAAGEEIATGDYANAEGARLVLRDQRVEVGLLETTRAGILHEGLGLSRAEAALITNATEDHLGGWGAHDLKEVTATHLAIQKGAQQLILNGDDPRLWEERPKERGDVVPWIFSLDADSDNVIATLTAGGDAFVLDGDELAHWSATNEESIIPLSEVPSSLGGAARHNIANALAACAVAVLLDFPIDAIRQGLANFASSPEDNPGRLNRFDLGGAQVIVDSAHNQHSFEALLTMANAMPAKRRLIVVGQTGDRSADDSRTLAHAIWRYRPDRIIVKELEERQEGHGLGRVPARIARVLRRIGAERSAIATAPSELAAARKALTWARRGDLIILTQQQGQGVLRYIQDLEKDGWRPRKPLPAVED